MSNIRIAIIGQGAIGPRHTDAVLNTPGTTLACIVDPHPSAAEGAAKYTCPIFTSVDAILEDKSIEFDAAIVCTPNHTHVTISKQLLQAGKHVLCEKPICVNVASGRELIKCAEDSKRALLIGHHRRFNRYAVAVKQHLPSLGRLVAINGLWTIYKPLSYFDPPTEWRRLDSAGPIFINLIHEIDLLHYWYGPITRVYAEQTISQRGFDAEEGAAITLRFASGLVGTFLLSDAVVSPHSFEGGTGENPIIPRTGQDFHRVFGSEGTLSVPNLTRWDYRAGENSWTKELSGTRLHVPDTKIPFEAQVEHFLKLIRGEELPSCDGAEGLRAVIVCEAIKTSMKEHRPVEIEAENLTQTLTSCGGS
ncbi:hypothetical protein E8E12_008715 [Didymella heteroderae]|uniref:Oxidoreductase n=1 Tax=Didymella heteroderae TaxID=1769908 RepID=A0A9P4WQ81_9PLEO|nr:hypothetical protein E8E12_008715 [Didymella heteroderae]